MASPSSDHDLGRLARRVRELTTLLGRTIARLEGRTVFEAVEESRTLAKAAREGEAGASDRLSRRVAGLTPGQADRLAMAFTLYFELVNLCEEDYRISLLRRRRARFRAGRGPALRQSIEAAVSELAAEGVSSEQMRDLLDRLRIEPVLTAHPTEAQRRTVLAQLRRLARRLREAGDDEDLSEDEELRRGIVSLWFTDRSRTRRPEVDDEVRTGLWYLRASLWSVVPELHEDLRRALARHYPDLEAPAGWLRLGSWIGGDRDGNPHVTAGVTARTLARHRRLALDLHARQGRITARQLSLSDRREPPGRPLPTVELEREDPELRRRAQRYPHEPYRLLMRRWAHALAEERAHARARSLLADGDGPTSWRRREAAQVLDGVEAALRAGRAGDLAEGELRRLRRQMESFGLHGARLDLRQHSDRHAEAVAEVLEARGLEADYAQRDEAGKRAVLDRLLARDEWRWTGEGFDEEGAAASVLEPLAVARRARARWGEEVLGAYVISMTAAPSDVLEALLLQRWAGVRLPIAPLLETLEDLRRGPELLRALGEDAAYLAHRSALGGGQMLMLGYSDSNKDCGYVTAAWTLHRAQEELVAAAGAVPLTFFHGRGGSIARGGGPAAEAVMAQPVSLVRGGIRLTEQGEVLSNRYHDPDLAHRVLEQLGYGVLKASHAAASAPATPPGAASTMEAVSGAARRAYEDLLHRTPGFLDFWRAATPIDEIGRLKLGSRPARRSAGGGLEDLRAIPWVFSWMQSRFNLPGWYGLGSGLAAVLETDGGGEELRRLHGQWPFFTTLLRNAQRTLSKADRPIARLYASLVEDQALRRRILDRVEAEWDRAEESILRITGQTRLLDDEPILQRSIELRNPYVDPLNYLQVECLRRLRRPGPIPDEEALREVVHLTIHGISAGLKNTG